MQYSYVYTIVENQRELNMTDYDRWISVDEVAAHLGVKRETVYTWIRARGLPAHRVGRLWKFNRIEVDEWVRSATSMGRNNDRT